MTLVAAGLALGGCATTTGATAAHASSSPTARGAQACPMAVPGTAVATADVGEGVALVFTTSTTGDVVELRERVRGMAALHNRHHAEGGRMLGDRDTGGATMMEGATLMPATTASVVDVKAGAQLVLAPRDPAQLLTLREHARSRAQKMTLDGCPMMAPRADAG
jgi:hypothetical protein